MCFENSDYLEKQRTLRWVSKSVLRSEGVVLGYSCDRKGLTWESSYKNIVSRYRRSVDLPYVASREISEVSFVRLLRKPVPLAREHAPAPGLFKGKPHPADSGKQIDELEIRQVELAVIGDG